jgi:hypothetical protein
VKEPGVPVESRRAGVTLAPALTPHGRLHLGPEEGAGGLACRPRRARHRPHLLGPELVPQPRTLQRLLEPPAAGAQLRPERLRRRPADRAGEGRRARVGHAPLHGPGRGGGRAAPALGGSVPELRGGHRLARRDPLDRPRRQEPRARPQAAGGRKGARRGGAVGAVRHRPRRGARGFDGGAPGAKPLRGRGAKARPRVRARAVSRGVRRL